MQRLITIFSLILVFNQLIFSQSKSKDLKVLWGQEIKDGKRSTLSDVVGYDDTGIYLIKEDFSGFKHEVTLEHFNHRMSRTRSSVLELKNDKKDRNMEFMTLLDNELYVFSSFINQKLKKNFLFVQTINKKSLRPNNDLEKIAEIDFKGKTKYNSGTFDFKISRDSSKVFVFYNLPYDKKKSERFGFHVFDNKLNQLWEQEIELPYLEELFDVEDYKVDNDGNVHLLGTIFNEKRKTKRSGEPNYKYQILSYFNNGRKQKEYPVSIPGKFLTDMQIAITDEADIVCGGFYSSEGTFSIEGSYFLRINTESGEIKSKNLQEFGIDFITQNMTDKEENKAKRKAAKGKNVELFKYDLDEIILRSDGGAFLVGEQFFVRVRTRTSPDGSVSTTTYYYYNDIIVVNIDPNGEIEWTEKIPKRQTTSNDGGYFSSYALAVVKQDLYFLFNDHPDNLDYADGDKLSRFNKSKGSLATMVKLNKFGKQERKALFSYKEAEVLIRPKVCGQIKNNEMVIFGKKRKIQRFAKVTFF